MCIWIQLQFSCISLLVINYIYSRRLKLLSKANILFPREEPVCEPLSYGGRRVKTLFFLAEDNKNLKPRGLGVQPARQRIYVHSASFLRVGQLEGTRYGSRVNSIGSELTSANHSLWASKSWGQWDPTIYLPQRRSPEKTAACRLYSRKCLVER